MQEILETLVLYDYETIFAIDIETQTLQQVLRTTRCCHDGSRSRFV